MRILSIIVVTLFAFPVFAEDISPTQAAEAFDRLLKMSNSKVSISEETAVAVGNTNYQTAVKVWFQLESNGEFVNPSLHRWNPKERFRVFVQTSVPAYFALYQNYPEDRPPTRQIYPDRKYPQTFPAVPAGSIFEVPVKFEMDNDLRKEIIILTFARIDDPHIGGSITVTATATASATATANTANTTVGAAAGAAVTTTETLQTRTDAAPMRSAASATGGVLMGARDVNQALDYLSSLSAKIGVAGVSATASASVYVTSTTVASINRDDVAVYVFGEGKIAQIQLTLNK
ncbi:MAG: hypothetical protein LBC74_01565 [Planctomycetaceae bacterium]|jgi:hypothetical protein|nr:hypothetical protein [Planctomycetaceae bacterium]